MAGEQLVVELIIDAGPAARGAQEFETAACRIQRSSNEATASVDKLGQAIDQTGARMARAGQATGTTALDQQIAGVGKYQAALKELADAHEQTIRRMQQGAFNVFDAQTALSSLAQVRRSVEGGRVPEPGEIAAMPFGRSLVPAAVTAAEIAPLTDAVFSSVHAGGPLAQATRLARQAQTADSTAGADIAKLHASESVAAAATPSAAQAAGSIAAAAPAPEQLLATEIAGLAAANSRAAAATEASATQVRNTAAQAATAPAVAAKVAAPTVAAGAERVAENAAGTTAGSAIHAAENIVAPAAAATVAGAPEVAKEVAAAAAALRPPPARPPNVAVEVAAAASALHAAPGISEAAAETGAIEQSLSKATGASRSFGAGLAELFLGIKSGTGAVHEGAEAVEGLATAHTHATGLSQRLREALVLFHEFLRGDWKRGVGSATIELQNFGALGYVFNPITLGLVAATGAMALLISRSADIDANLRSFTATLRVMGTGSQASAQDLQRLVDDLHHTGVAADEAKKTVDALAHTPGLSAAAFPRLADIARNRAAFEGGDVSARAEELSKATRGGVEGLIQYGAAIKAFDQAQIEMLRHMDQAGASQQAMTRAIDLIAQHLPKSTELLSDFGRQVQNLTNSWDELITSLSKSPTVQGTISAITAVLHAAATPTGQSVIGGTVAGAAGLAIGGGFTGLGLATRAAIGAVAGGAIGAESNPLGRNIAAGATVGGLLAAPSGIGVVPGALIGGGIAGAATLATEGVKEIPQGWLDSIGGAIKGALTIGGAGSPEVTALPDAVRGNTSAVHELTTTLQSATTAFGNFAGREREAYNTPSLPLPTGDLANRLIGAVVQAESGNLPPEKQISSTGALGVMQVKLDTAQGIVPGVTREQLLNNPELNRAIGTTYLGQLTEQFGSIRAGLEAYNAGPERFRRFQAGAEALPRGTQEYASGILRNAGLTGNETAGQIGFAASGAITATTPLQLADIAKLHDLNKDMLADLAKEPGYAQQLAQEYTRLRQQALEKFPDAQEARDKFVAEQYAVAVDKLAIAYGHEHEAASRSVDQQARITAGYAQSTEAGLRAEAQVKAENAQRLQGGAGVGPRQADILNVQAQEAIAGTQRQLQGFEPAIAGQRRRPVCGSHRRSGLGATIRGREPEIDLGCPGVDGLLRVTGDATVRNAPKETSWVRR
jgi:hypothetical protein